MGALLRYAQRRAVFDRASQREKSDADQSSEANQGHRHSPRAAEREPETLYLPLWLVELRMEGGGWGGRGHPDEEPGGCSASLPGKLRASRSASVCLSIKWGGSQVPPNYRIVAKCNLSFTCDCGQEVFNSLNVQRG